MKYPLALAFIFSLINLFCQPPNDNCLNATLLCANQINLFSNNNATIDVCPGCSDGTSTNGNFCFELNNTVWFYFTTNSIGGSMTADFSNIDCNNGNPNSSNELQAIILSASNPCNENSYIQVSNCESGSSNNFTLLASNLAPNTTYYIQVDGGDDAGVGIINPAECGFSINLSGQAIESSVNAGVDQYIFPGESALLSGFANGSIDWSPSASLSNANIASPIASPSATTTYTLSSNENNCIYTDLVTVFVQDNINIPNAITPNEDGYNDTWTIGNIQNYPGAQVSVYDRWGQRVFNITGYTSDKEWDGTNNGLRLPSGTYYYVIELRANGISKLYNGAITIIR